MSECKQRRVHTSTDQILGGGMMLKTLALILLLFLADRAAAVKFGRTYLDGNDNVHVVTSRKSDIRITRDGQAMRLS
jgi:hypothetical protein